MKNTNTFTLLQPLMPAHITKEFDISRHPTLTLKQERGGLKHEITKQEPENPEIIVDPGFVKHEDPKSAIAMPEYC
jgi:hypothetical protein